MTRPPMPVAGHTPLPEAVDVLVVGGGATGAGVLRDLARRGLRGLLIDKEDLGSGTSGRYHGLLHSGGRYAVRDPLAARECALENAVLRRIAPACIEETGGWFVATAGDDETYADGFAAACAAAGVPCTEAAPAELLAREPAVTPAARRAFRVPDASLEPWQLIEANLADARARGSEARPYQRLVALERAGDRVVAARIRDERSGSLSRVAVGFVVSATGAWAGQVAALAGLTVRMAPGKGTMLIFNERLTDTIVNRCHPPGDGDIMVPVHTVAILGTTDVLVEDPDRYPIPRDEVLHLLDLGEELFPGLRQRRVLRAYAGVRPIYRPSEGEAPGGGGERDVSRSHVILDHAERDGLEGLVSVVGGKLTTYRLMAEQAVDLVARRMGVAEACTTADEPLPAQATAGGRTYWLGERLAAHEAQGGGDADLICECELVTRDALERFLDERWPCSLDDVRRGTRLGMGPCQGGFCAFRAAGVMAARWSRDGEEAPGDLTERALVDFLRERSRGTEPIAWGRQLQELWFVAGLYLGTLGLADAGEGDHAQR